MSSYNHMIVDFPARIAELLAAYENGAATRGRETTLLLALAGPAITLPLERLKPQHASGDYQSNPALAQLRTTLKQQPFLGSPLWPEPNIASWQHGGPLKTTQGDPDSWQELAQPTPLRSDIIAWDVLWHLRNALSHGNVYTTGFPQISVLVFLSWVSRTDQRYMYLAANPTDFRRLLKNWLALLQPVHFPSAVLAEEFAAA